MKKRIEEINKRLRYTGSFIFHDRAAEYSNLCKMINTCIDKTNEVVRAANEMDARIYALEALEQIRPDNSRKKGDI